MFTRLLSRIRWSAFRRGFMRVFCWNDISVYKSRRVEIPRECEAEIWRHVDELFAHVDESLRQVGKHIDKAMEQAERDAARQRREG